MKFLIWFGCFIVASILNTILGYATGIKAGYLIFYFAVVFVAKKLCAKWDEHKEAKKKQKRSAQSVTQPIHNTHVPSLSEVRFCRRCGEKLIDNSCFCSKCGTEIIKE